jgi:sialate O-acetylesterase
MDQKETPTPSAWAELRDAQFNSLQLPHTGMAVTIDIGNADNIHPKNKQEVGRRLALIALAKNYGERIEYSGPLYTSFKKKDNSIIIDFDHAKRLHSESDQLKGFEIAGKDHIFHWANASIDGNTIAVSSPEVNAPIAVRYSWADNPKGNLYNHAGLPASPFRTDKWPGITDSNH